MRLLLQRIEKNLTLTTTHQEFTRSVQGHASSVTFREGTWPKPQNMKSKASNVSAGYFSRSLSLHTFDSSKLTLSAALSESAVSTTNLLE